MTKNSLFRLSAFVLVLSVVFTQAGLALLHTHQGVPDCHAAAVQSAPEAGTSCQVCALDAVMMAEVATVSTVADQPETPVPASFVTEIILLAFSGDLHGRAPPVC